MYRDSPSSIGNITSSLFTGNIIEATNGDLLGGLIYTGDDLTIENSVFAGNEFTSGGTFHGTVSIDTSKDCTDSNHCHGGKTDTHTVTLKASGGQTTLFRNNVANGTASNSIALRNIRNANSAVNAELNIVTSDKEGPGTVALYEPIWVALNGKTFNMTVSGEGDFLWGGANTVTSGGSASSNVINLGDGSTNANKTPVTAVTTLLPGFSLDKDGKGMAAVLTFNLNPGETLLSQVEESKGGSKITVDTINLKSDGILAFDLTGAEETTYDSSNGTTKDGTTNLTLSASTSVTNNPDHVDIYTFSDEGDYRLASFSDDGDFSSTSSSATLTIRGETEIGKTRAAGISLQSADEDNGEKKTLVLQNAPQTGTVTWVGEKSGGGTWNITTQNWNTLAIGDENDKHFLYGDDVLFTDTGAGEVNIAAYFHLTDAMDITFNNSTGNDYTLKGNPLRGNGTQLIKKGDGLLTLDFSVANTYAGGTTVEGGFINFSRADNFGTAKITLDGGGLQWAKGINIDISGKLNPLESGGGVFDTNGNEVTLASVIRGDGGLTKIGEGILSLRGTNTYEGGTTIIDGLVNFSRAENFGTGQITLDGGGLQWAEGIDIDISEKLNDLGKEGGIFDTNGNDVTLEGVIRGDGGLTKTGAGTLILTLDNDYKGATTILDGVLSIGADREDDTGKKLHFLGTLDNEADIEVANLLSGGTLKITETGNYDQNWSLAQGETNIIEVDPGEVATFRDAVLSGDGGFTKDGGGTLILNASGNSVGGAVEVNAGSLIVGGSGSQTAEGKYQASDASLTATSGVTVENGALLGGHGTIAGDVLIHKDGILSPGNSPGKLRIETNLIVRPGGIFKVEVDPNQPWVDPATPGVSDQVIVENKATLEDGAIVSHFSEDSPKGNYLTPGKKWLILSADNLDLDIETLMMKSDLAYLLPQLALAEDGNGAEELYLYFIRNDSRGDLTDTLDPESELSREIANNVTESQRPRILNELSGESHASLQGFLLTRDDTFLRRLRHHVSGQSSPGKTPTASTDNGIWMGINQSSATLDGHEKTARSTWSGTELFGGYDHRFANDWLGGIAFRLEDGRQEIDDRRSEAEIISITASIYGGKELPAGPGALRVLLAGAITRHDIENKRNVQITRNQKLETHYTGKTASASLETAYRVSSSNEQLSVEPYAALTHHRLSMDGFTEKGGNAALKSKKETETQTRGTLGMRFSTSPKSRVTFDADVGWQHLFGSATPKSRFSFREGGSNRFITPGAPVNKNAAILGLSVGAKINKHAQLRLQYHGELGSQGKSHEGQVVLEIKW